jgi:hypothetical protein
MMAAYTAAYAWSTPSADTADELLRAYEIRHGIAFPLEGPFLGGALHLGPTWWYLTALPLFVSHSWLATALFVGAICSLKFPLAYACGRVLIDARFGLLWAVAMFVPGWPSLEPLVFLNPNAVAAAALLVLWVALKCLEPGRGWPMFAALGLALATAVHVHPTSAPALLLVPALLWARLERHEGVVAPIAAMAVAFLVPFAPYALAEIRGGFADVTSASAYLTNQVVVANIVNAPIVIAEYLFEGPRIVAEYLLQWRRGLASVLGAIGVLVACMSVAAAFDRRARRWLGLFCAALLIFAAWIACTRPTTPFQFTWVLCPVVGVLVALGLWSVGRTAAASALVWAACIVAVALNLWVIYGMAAAVLEGDGRLPSRIMDIKGRIPPTVFRDVWFPAYAHERLGRILCDAGEVALHGHLAYLADKDLGLDALFVCNDRSRLSLAASAAPAHLFGMTRRFWKATGAEPECWVGSLGLTRRMTPLLQRAPIAVADGSTYMPRKLNRDPPQGLALVFRASGSALVALTNVLGDYESFRLVSVEADGQRVAPLAQNDFSALFAAPPGRGGAVSWTFSLMATNPQAIEAVAIEVASPPSATVQMRACT